MRDPLAPLAPELVEVDVFGLVGARREGRDLARAPGARAEGGEVRFDLLAAGGEASECVGSPGFEFGEAVVGCVEAPSEALVDLVAEVGAVGVAEGQLPAPQERLRVERAPLLVIALGEVRDCAVGVELRVEVAGEAVRVERCRDATRTFAHETVSACAYEGCFVFEEGEGGIDGGMVCGEDLASGSGLGEGVCGADALGGGEHEVEPADRLQLAHEARSRARFGVRDRDREVARAHDAAEALAGQRMRAVEQRLELARLDGAFESEGFRCVAEPASFGFAVACVVVLAAGCDLVCEVAGATGGEGGAVDHAGSSSRRARCCW